MGLSDLGPRASAANQTLIRPGDYVSGYDSGSSGGLAWDTSRQCLVLLSCQHVFGTQGERLKSVFQVPVARVVRTAFRIPGDVYDAAIADPGRGSRFDLQSPLASVIVEIDASNAAQDVTFVNRTQAHRTARWTGTSLSGPVPESSVQHDFARFYVLKDADPAEGLAEQGDSGAILFVSAGDSRPAKSVGMLFAGFESSDRWYAFHLTDVFTALGLEPLAEAPFIAFLASVCGERHADERPFEFLFEERDANLPDPRPPDHETAASLKRKFGDAATEMAQRVPLASRVALLERLLNDKPLRIAVWSLLRGVMHTRQQGVPQDAVLSLVNRLADTPLPELATFFGRTKEEIDSLNRTYFPPNPARDLVRVPKLPITKK